MGYSDKEIVEEIELLRERIKFLESKLNEKKKKNNFIAFLSPHM